MGAELVPTSIAITLVELAEIFSPGSVEEPQGPVSREFQQQQEPSASDIESSQVSGQQPDISLAQRAGSIIPSTSQGNLIVPEPVIQPQTTSEKCWWRPLEKTTHSFLLGIYESI